MDEGLSRAVTEVFVRLHEEGLIYRGKRLVNWDPVLLTAVSDLEVESEEEDGYLWHLRYPLADGSGPRRRRHHAPGDHARRHRGGGASGRRALHAPRRQAAAPAARPTATIPVIADDYVDREFGTGVREDHAGARLQRLRSRPAPRAAADQHLHAATRRSTTTRRSATAASTASRRASACVADLEAPGLLEQIEQHKLHGAARRPHRRGARAVSHRPVVREDRAARRRRRSRAVESGRTRFVPENWTQHLLPVDAQHPGLVHQPPALVGPPHPGVVRRGGQRLRRPQTRPKCARSTTAAPACALRQDEDVLDTWFSSALWPFSTLGWPRADAGARDASIRRSVLVTGFDIIFFWVARMIMMATALHRRGAVPRRLHHTASIRDARRPEDVQVQGQRPRPARPDRRHRRSRRWSPSAPAA